MIDQEIITRLFPTIEVEMFPIFATVATEHTDAVFSAINRIDAVIERFRNAGNEETENALFVANAYKTSIEKYLKTISLILEKKFEASWGALQDSADALRVVKRFADYEVEYLEQRIVSLEELYPYSVFFSIDAVTKPPICSICGLEYNSSQCFHIAGELYGGVMAHKRIDEFIEVMSVACVKNPENKRCVIQYGDDAPQFRLISLFSDFYQTQRLPFGAFSCVRKEDNRIGIILDGRYLPETMLNSAARKTDSDSELMKLCDIT
jgi:hypothetical protein